MFKRSVKITRIKKGEVIEMQDDVLIESPVDIIVNTASLVNIICLPQDLKELTVGFLYSIGLIDKFEDIDEIIVDELDNKVSVKLKENIAFNIDDLEINPVSRVVETTCGISTPWRNAIKKTLDNVKDDLKSDLSLKIKVSTIHDAIVKMQKETVLFRETGGCHGAAIFTTEGELLEVKEDIGRHNAIDKAIGAMLIKKHKLDDVFLTSTGRLTGDSVLKAIRARIPILASLSAAIESGIRLAFTYGITLVGFVRGSRMNIYTHPERITK